MCSAVNLIMQSNYPFTTVSIVSSVFVHVITEVIQTETTSVGTVRAVTLNTVLMLHFY